MTEEEALAARDAYKKRYPMLTQAWKEAQARFDALRPEQQRAHREAQAASYARSLAPCEHGVADFEQCPECRKPKDTQS